MKVISSMATRQLLADLVQAYEGEGGEPVTIESVGGVEAARRVLEGETFDAVVLADNAIERLSVAGKIVADSKVDIVRSGIALAVRSGAAVPDIGDEPAVRAAVSAARSVGYSTGPSGVYLAGLFERWGLSVDGSPRIVQAPPGVPVGKLVASGEVELGFQQLSELMHLQGIEVVGSLPPDIQLVTVFSAAICATANQRDAAQAFLAFLASASTRDAKLANGMEPA